MRPFQSEHLVLCLKRSVKDPIEKLTGNSHSTVCINLHEEISKKKQGYCKRPAKHQMEFPKNQSPKEEKMINN